jgi:rhodanese-related sulfurtransferase
MNNKNIKYLIFLFLALLGLQTVSLQAQVYGELSVLQCDSLIIANTDNPAFVILDVRRPTEYNPEHLEGAINKDYYSNYFESSIDSFDREKLYLIHCRSGARSANAFALMKSLGFNEVYNMLGGIKDWKNNGLPVTDQFAPLLMSASDTIFPLEEVLIGETDTLSLAITNRANALLIFQSICSLEGSEFHSDFDQDTSLTGAGDYYFNIYYTPVDKEADTLSFCIESNGGNINYEIIRRGYDTASGLLSEGHDKFYLYPNPAVDVLYMHANPGEEAMIRLFDQYGQLILSRNVQESGREIDISQLPEGIYFWQWTHKQSSRKQGKLIIRR